MVLVGLSQLLETLKGNGPSRRRNYFLSVNKVCLIVKWQLETGFFSKNISSKRLEE